MSYSAFLAWIGGFMVVKFSMNTSLLQLGAIMLIAGALLGSHAVNLTDFSLWVFLHIPPK